MISFLRNLFGHGEKFLVIEVFGGYLDAWPLTARFSERKITFKKPKRVRILPPGSPEGLSAALGKLGVAKLAGRCRAIIGLPSRLASTETSFVSVIREEPKRTIDENDIDNIIFQAVWRLFDRSRLRSARKLGTADIDVVLADTRVLDIKVDGHKVFNPIGFAAKTADVYLSETFLNRPFSEEIKSRFIKNGGDLRITERGVAAVSVLKELSENRQAFLVFIFEENSQIFFGSPDKVCFAGEFGWGFRRVWEAIVGELGVSENVAKIVYDRYLKNAASPPVIRLLEKVFMKEFSLFVKGLELAAKPFSGKGAAVFLKGVYGLPETVFTRRFGKFRMIDASPADLLKNRGFRAEPEPGPDFFGAAALFLESEFSGEKKFFNRLAARRTKWLTGV